MRFPVSYEELRLWIAMVAVILLTTSELLSVVYGRTNIYVNRDRLKRVSQMLGSLVLLSFLVQIFILFIT
jgi:hypothetical protein